MVAETEAASGGRAGAADEEVRMETQRGRSASEPGRQREAGCSTRPACSRRRRAPRATVIGWATHTQNEENCVNVNGCRMGCECELLSFNFNRIPSFPIWTPKDQH